MAPGGNTYNGTTAFSVHPTSGAVTALARLDFESPQTVWVVFLDTDSGSVSLPMLSVAVNVSIVVVSSSGRQMESLCVRQQHRE